MSGFLDGRDRCGVTGKDRFETKEAAAAMIAAHGRSKGARQVTRRCPFCEGFHTSKGARKRPMRGK